MFFYKDLILSILYVITEVSEVMRILDEGRITWLHDPAEQEKKAGAWGEKKGLASPNS